MLRFSFRFVSIVPLVILSAALVIPSVPLVIPSEAEGSPTATFWPPNAPLAVLPSPLILVSGHFEDDRGDTAHPQARSTPAHPCVLSIMLRKEYLTPEVGIVHLTPEACVLAGSQNGTGANVTWNGEEKSFDDYFNN